VPLTTKGEHILKSMEGTYGKEKAEQVLYASKNAGTISGIDAIADACHRVADQVETLHRRMDAYADRQSRKDATRAYEHEMTIRYSGDFDMAELIRALWWLGQAGASREIEVAASDAELREQLKRKGYRTEFGWDGDGADKIISATIDGDDVLK